MEDLSDKRVTVPSFWRFLDPPSRNYRKAVAVLDRGRGPRPPHFLSTPQFFHRLLIIAPPLGARGPAPPQRVLARTATH